jgi:hypothetical protein
MPRRHWKTRDYNPITKKRLPKGWPDEKLFQVKRELRQAQFQEQLLKERNN